LLDLERAHGVFEIFAMNCALAFVLEALEFYSLLEAMQKKEKRERGWMLQRKVTNRSHVGHIRAKSGCL
jgi:hypothetical protein